MFTGIVKEVGEIKKIVEDSGNRMFEVQCAQVILNKKLGDSIAVDGACHTVVELLDEGFVFQSIPETLKLTTMGNKAVGDWVNLESAMTMNDTLDGHIVLGHVDCMAEVVEIKPEGEGSYVVIFKLPKGIEKFIAYKGSVCVNGISLTVSALQDETFGVSLIPHTWLNTTMRRLEVGKKVNIEIDPLMRYVERLMEWQGKFL